VRKWTEYLWRCPFIAAIDGQRHRAESACSGTFAGVHYQKLISTAVYPREVAKSCLRTNCAAVIIGHNHPSGTTEPSSADKRITERVTSALGLLDIRVLDHVIVSSSGAFSFAESGLL